MLLELLVVIGCGIGTFLLRCVPIWRARRCGRTPHGRQASDTHGHVQRFFTGIGPAALSALLLVSVWPFFADAGNVSRMLAALVALIVVYVSKRLMHGLAGPTLLGSAVYGVLMHWIAVSSWIL